MDYIDIIKKVYQVYKDCQIKTFPIDCFSILDHYNFMVFTYSQLHEIDLELYELGTSLSNDAFSDMGLRIAAYNERLNQYRIRFSLMHELGHFILEHKSEKTKQTEDEADCFASNILAPRPLIKHMHIKDAEELHNRFAVSYTAANNAWSNYMNRWKLMPPVDMDTALIELIYPTLTPNKLSKTTQSAKQRKSRRHYKMEKKIDFMLQYSPDFFGRAEHYKLYGDDL